MRRRLRSHLTYANVMSTLAVFLVIGGGAAYAANTVGSSDIIDQSILHQDIQDGQVFNTEIADNTTRSGDIRNDTSVGDGLTAPDLGPSSVGGSEIASNAVGAAEVADNSLTGADIEDNSGVDSCPTPATLRFGRICAGSDGTARNLGAGLSYCAGLDLRLPTVGEGVALALNNDVPGVSASDFFWTDEQVYISGLRPLAVDEDGGVNIPAGDSVYPTVCVTTPTN
jgi:hypothetical protein